MINYQFRIFNYNWKRFDSLKKECPANFLHFFRDFWEDKSSGLLPLSFYGNIAKQDTLYINVDNTEATYKTYIHTKTNRNMHRHKETHANTVM